MNTAEATASKTPQAMGPSAWLAAIAIAAALWVLAYANLTEFADFATGALRLSRGTRMGEAVHFFFNAAGVLPIVEALIGKGAALGTTLAFMMSVIALSLPEILIRKHRGNHEIRRPDHTGRGDRRQGGACGRRAAQGKIDAGCPHRPRPVDVAAADVDATVGWLSMPREAICPCEE